MDQGLADGSYLSPWPRPRSWPGPPGSDHRAGRAVPPVGHRRHPDRDLRAAEHPARRRHRPAAELAKLYHARWQIENAFGAFKSQLKGDGVVLRSKTPDGAEQELWALLCAYHAIRELICAVKVLRAALSRRGGQ